MLIMVFGIIASVILVIAGIVKGKGVLAFIGLPLFFFSVFFPITGYGYISPDIYTVKYADIACIQDSTSNFKGLFISSDNYYFFYKINKDGSYSLDKLYADNCIIYEEDIDYGYIDKDYEKYNEKYKLWLYTGSFPASKYKIHVPKGSVSTEFFFDAQ